MLKVCQRLLILCVLAAGLTLVLKDAEAQSSGCSGCTTTYNTCQVQCNGEAACLNNCANAYANCQSTYCHSAGACERCSDDYFSCLGGCEQARQECVQRHDPDCNSTASFCSSACDATYSSCRNQNCGGGGGGGVGCNGTNMGYSRSCVTVLQSSRDQCLAQGSSGSTYLQCMGLYNDNAYCCEQQYNADIEEGCRCQLDTRNPDCVCNP